MFLFRLIVSLLDWLFALLWLWRVLTWRRNLKRVPDLTRSGMEDSPVALPRLTVVVPARNEGGKIAGTLRSLLRSEGVSPEIIAVDDRSEDQTGSIMEEIAAGHAARAAAGQARLRVLHVKELPSCWLGKTYAMALGAGQASGEWLLFTDGDVLFRPDALRRALAFAVASHADHLVLLPTLLAKNEGERMTTSFLQVMSLWLLRLWRVSDPDSKRDALGVGAFNLIRRETYDALGGWRAFRTEVVEDLALGRRVKQSGFTQRVVLGPDLVSVRWIEGAFGIVENLAKNLFAFFSFRAGRLLAFLPVFFVFTLLPFAALFAGTPAVWATAIMLVAVWLAYRRQGEYQHFSVWQMLLFPVASLLILYTLIRSMVVVLWRGGILWRGTFYPLSQLKRQPQR